MLDLTSPVKIILDLFAVVVGVAIERFLTESSLFTEPYCTKPWLNGQKRWLRVLFCWACLTILTSLALRFLVGSEHEMHAAYKSVQGVVPIYWFFEDLAFLLVFGVFLVKTALSTKPEDFVLWLIRFFVAAIIWSLIDFVHLRMHDPTGIWWFGVNLIQLLLAVAVFFHSRSEPKKVPIFFAFLAVCYATLFGADVLILVANGSV
jgi:hypothetical protein